LSKNHNVFLSWSGERSRLVAEFMRSWLASVVQAAKPWMSESEIDKGTRSLAELPQALSDIRVGIVCLTPENLTKPWLLFEAGALSKNIDERARLCTYLIGDLQSSDVVAPLGMFQDTKTTKDDTLRMVRTINRVVSEEPLAEEPLTAVFEAMWPKLQERLQSLPTPSEAVPAKRSNEDIMNEVLELVRTQASQREKVQFIDAYLPTLQQFLPLLQQLVLNSPRVPAPAPRQILHPQDTSLERNPIGGFLNTLALPRDLLDLISAKPQDPYCTVNLVQMRTQSATTPEGLGLALQFTVKGAQSAATAEACPIQFVFDIESANRVVAYIAQTLKTTTWRPTQT